MGTQRKSKKASEITITDLSKVRPGPEANRVLERFRITAKAGGVEVTVEHDHNTTDRNAIGVAIIGLMATALVAISGVIAAAPGWLTLVVTSGFALATLIGVTYLTIRSKSE